MIFIGLFDVGGGELSKGTRGTGIAGGKRIGADIVTAFSGFITLHKGSVPFSFLSVSFCIGGLEVISRTNIHDTSLSTYCLPPTCLLV